MNYRSYGTGSQTIIFFPPGEGVVDIVTPLIQKFARHYKILLIYPPGTHGSRGADTTITGIADDVHQLLSRLNIQNPTLIGVSYGGNIALELTRRRPIQGLILITSGEYFTNLQRTLLKLLFWPAYTFKNVRSAYAVLLTHLGIKDFAKSTAEDLKIISDRWWEILSYRLPATMMKQDALLIFATKDKILTRKSEEKIIRLLPNAHIKHISSGHLDILPQHTDEIYKEACRHMEIRHK